MNNASLHRNAWASVLDPGLRFFPFELVTQRGLQRASKNNRFLVAVLIKSSGGTPNISIMHANCSTSFSPGKSGYPVYNSAKIQPVVREG